MAGKTKSRPLSLALQGGGAHGAYTWGVLDRLLEDDSLEISAVTATSAGAVNAVALVSGLQENGRKGAQVRLEAVWKAVADEGLRTSPLGTSATGFAIGSVLQNFASPYDFNPLNLNPLRTALESALNFEAVRDSELPLFVTATNVETGKVKVFSGEEVTLDAVLASAALPQTFRAVEIDNAAYWDGGYMGNPSLFPLIYSDAPRDVLLVLLNPIARAGIPRRAGDIAERINEISFNQALIGELRAIAFVRKLIDEGMMTETAKGKYRRLNIHAMFGGRDLIDLEFYSKYDSSWRFLTKLRDMGRSAAESWLGECAEHVGTGTSSVDLRRDFLDG